MPLVKSLFFHIKSPPPPAPIPAPNLQLGWGNLLLAGEICRGKICCCLPGKPLAIQQGKNSILSPCTIGKIGGYLGKYASTWGNVLLSGEICCQGKVLLQGKITASWGNLLLYLGNSIYPPGTSSTWGYTLIRWGIPYYIQTIVQRIYSSFDNKLVNKVYVHQ